jgi:phosphate transport system ATP-binding protein
MTSQQLSPTMTDAKRDSDRPAASGSVPVSRAGEDPGVVMDCRIKTLHYGNFLAVRDTDIPIVPHEITAFIGPSGCGKSTVLRSLNRMNDFVNGFRFTGSVHYRGQDIYAPNVDPVAVRTSIGMVFKNTNTVAIFIFYKIA